MAEQTTKKSTTRKTATRKPATKPKTSKVNTKATDQVAETKAAEQLTWEYPFVGYFEKVPFDDFLATALKYFEIEDATDEQIAQINEMYQAIELPKRVNNRTSEYHFMFPFPDTHLPAYGTTIIPTGINCQLAQNWNLEIVSESYGVGLQVDSGIMIVNPDDQSWVDEESGKTINGQICIKIENRNLNNNTLTLKHGSMFAKGMFRMFGLAYNEKLDN